MDAKSKLTHMGLTVADIDRTYTFYHKHFGFERVLDGVLDENYIRNFQHVFRLEDGMTCDFSVLQAPNGFCLELFCFKKTVDGEAVVWNRPGYHHICLDVPDVRDKFMEMVADGVTFCIEPSPRWNTVPEDGKFFAYLFDPDGNYIELH